MWPTSLLPLAPQHRASLGATFTLLRALGNPQHGEPTATPHLRPELRWAENHGGRPLGLLRAGGGDPQTLARTKAPLSWLWSYLVVLKSSLCSGVVCKARALPTVSSPWWSLP